MRPQPKDAFAAQPRTIEYADSAAGSGKTTKALAQSVEAAQRGGRIMFAMPTEALIEQKAAEARKLDPKLPVVTIHSHHKLARKSVAKSITEYVEQAPPGHILFVTHEGMLRVSSWPLQVRHYHLIIDEVIDIMLMREPFRLRHSYWVLLAFLAVEEMTMTPDERGFDFVTQEGKDRYKARLDQARNVVTTYEQFIAGKDRYPPALVSKSEERLPAAKLKLAALLAANKEAATSEVPYYRVMPKRDTKSAEEFWGVQLRARDQENDDIYKYLGNLPRWLVEGAVFFTDKRYWDVMVTKIPKLDAAASLEEQIQIMAMRMAANAYDRGRVTITGFRHPDFLKLFGRVTIMSALFTSTMMYQVWQKLGIDFQHSDEIDLAIPTIPLGKRKLRIYWLVPDGWSKSMRNRSGGIVEILKLIDRAKVIDKKHKVCVVLNVDDNTPENREMLKSVFGDYVPLPHNTRGQSIYNMHHQLVYLPSLNSYTPDIAMITKVLGIDSHDQRIARLANEVYQTLARLSIRDPDATHDITLIVPDKDVAEWLADELEPKFDPVGNVEVYEIDSSSVIKRSRQGQGGGRPKIDRSPEEKRRRDAERQRQSRSRRMKR